MRQMLAHSSSSGMPKYQMPSVNRRFRSGGRVWYLLQVAIQ
jgi:hypothetical protein